MSALCGKMRKKNALIRAYLRIGGKYSARPAVTTVYVQNKIETMACIARGPSGRLTKISSSQANIARACTPT